MHGIYSSFFWCGKILETALPWHRHASPRWRWTTSFCQCCVFTSLGPIVWMAPASAFGSNWDGWCMRWSWPLAFSAAGFFWRNDGNGFFTIWLGGINIQLYQGFDPKPYMMQVEMDALLRNGRSKTLTKNNFLATYSIAADAEYHENWLNRSNRNLC